MTSTTAVMSEASGFEVFKLIEREGERPEWRKIGSAATRDGGFSVRIEGLRDDRLLRAAAIDRCRRPVPTGQDARRFPSHELFEGDARVGVLFVNRDASFTIVIDEGEREGPKTRLQMRIARSKRPRTDYPSPGGRRTLGPSPVERRVDRCPVHCGARPSLTEAARRGFGG